VSRNDVVDSQQLVLIFPDNLRVLLMRSVANLPFLEQINLSLQNRVSALFISFVSGV
jgi:hypothetical protein